MKVLIAVHHFPPNFHGGAEWRAYRTARNLIKEGHETEVLCVDSITEENKHVFNETLRIYDGIRVHGLSLNLPKSSDQFTLSYQNPFIGQYISNFINEFKPDIFHLISGYLMSGSTIESAIHSGVPTVVTLTDFWFMCPRITLVRSDKTICNPPQDSSDCVLCLRKEMRRYRLPDKLTAGLAGRLLSLIWRKTGSGIVNSIKERKDYLFSLLDKVDVVISPSIFLKDMFDSQGVSQKNMIHMRQGLDIDCWGNQRPKSSSNSQLRIGYIGQIAPHKGVHILIKAFRMLQGDNGKNKLTLHGDLDQFSHFSLKLIKDAARRKDIVFAGKFDNSRIRSIHEDIDVLVVPSLWYENSPNVILEAFAVKTPVVVSKLGGMSELVSDGVNGFHFEPGNIKSLARVLKRFIDDPDLVHHLAENAPPVRSTKEEIHDLLNIYKNISKDHPQKEFIHQ